MNRRDAFKAIGAALVGTSAANAELQTSASNERPAYLVVKISDDIDFVDQAAVKRYEKLIQDKCERIGWGKNFPVFVAVPGINIEIGQPVNVTIPPNTIVEQLGEYTVIYPVGKRPCA